MRAGGKQAAVWMILVLLGAASAWTGEGALPGANPISAAEAWRRLQSGERIVLVDVRDTLEREVDGNIPGDVSIPLSPKDRFADTIQRAIPDHNMPVFLYCKGGIPTGLSAQAASIMAGVGYRNQVYITGGYDHWPYDRSK